MSAATRRASRVLPEPPGPVTVTNRDWFNSRRSVAISRSRPTKVVTARAGCASADQASASSDPRSIQHADASVLRVWRDDYRF